VSVPRSHASTCRISAVSSRPPPSALFAKSMSPLSPSFQPPSSSFSSTPAVPVCTLSPRDLLRACFPLLIFLLRAPTPPAAADNAVCSCCSADEGILLVRPVRGHHSQTNGITRTGVTALDDCSTELCLCRDNLAPAVSAATSQKALAYAGDDRVNRQNISCTA
jgi:hypothetical protein